MFLRITADMFFFSFSNSVGKCFMILNVLFFEY